MSTGSPARSSTQTQEGGTNDDDDLFPVHRPLSPATPAESFFLTQLGTSDISAFALASQINRDSRQNKFSAALSSASKNTQHTDDFESACQSHGSAGDLLEEIPFDDDSDHNVTSRGLFGTDPLVISRTPIKEEPRSFHQPDITTNGTMSSKKSAAKTTTPAPAPAKATTTTTKGSTTTTTKPATTPAPAPATKKEETKPVSTVTAKEEKKEEDNVDHFDVTQHVYEGAKSVWAFGKNIIVFKPFMGLAEGIASTFVGIGTGMDLPALDEGIKPKLAGLDDAFINPAISAVVHLISPVVEMGANVVKPVVMTVGPPILGPLGLFPSIEDEKKTDVEVAASGKDTKKTDETKKATDSKKIDEKKKMDEKEKLHPEVTKPVPVK